MFAATEPLDRRRKHERKKAAESAEIGDLPLPADPDRRRTCELDLGLALFTYFPDTIGLTCLGQSQCRVIDRMQSALRNGGHTLNLVYRGFGKTTITECSVLMAILYGWRRYIAILGATLDLAKDIIHSITQEVESNELLAADFPEAIVPFLHLQGKGQRARSQTYQGELTHLYMNTRTLVFPTIPGSVSGGGIIKAFGMNAAVRGMKHKRPDGQNARPDMAVGDDLQTDEGAANPQRCRQLLTRFYKSVLMSGGHRRRLAAAVNGTIIEPDDAMVELADPERHPSWMSEKVPMVLQWAQEHDGLWQEYRKLRHAFDRHDPQSKERAYRAATEFYRTRRAQMDAGCLVDWHNCYDPDCELSAIQHAYNLYFDYGHEVFMAECQLDPQARVPHSLAPLSPIEVARRLNGLPRGSVPEEATYLNAGVDVHGDVLYWAVVGWSQYCRGWVVDYGTYPKQPVAYFTKRQARRTLADEFPGAPPESAVLQALQTLLPELLARRFPHGSGYRQIQKLLVDVGWFPGEVDTALRTSGSAELLQASRGKPVDVKNKPYSQYEKKKGWILGGDGEWYIKPEPDRLPWLYFDTNHWKTWLYQRWLQPITVDGGLSLFGADPEPHRMLSEHALSEKPTEVSANGRSIIEWDLPPNRDNHLLDNLVQCAVGLHVLGGRLHDDKPRTRPSNRRERFIQVAREQGLLE